MTQYGPYEYTEIEVSEMTKFLQGQARREKAATYNDAYNAIRQFGEYYGPRDQRLWHLLGLVSENEIASGRPALSAIVVRSEDGRPGVGFFELEKSLGRYLSGDDATWTGEINALFDYWPKH